MENIISTTTTSSISLPAARLSIAASVVALVSLAALHVLSPEFDPAWRMVSEYALGQYTVVLSLMFISWAIGAWALAFAIRKQVTTQWGKIGLGFLMAAGIGEAMASVFDVKHELHGLSAVIGAPSLPIAALLLSVHLGRTQAWSSARKTILWTANLTWISLVLFAITMVVLMVTFTQAGGNMNGEPVWQLPEEVIAINGWTNRLWIVMYCTWVISVARQAIRFAKGMNN